MTPNGDPVEAMKRTGNKILEKMEKEVQLMSSLDHPNVVSLIGFCRVPACIMTELCSGGNLAQNLSTCKEKNIPLEWKTRIRYVRVTLFCLSVDEFTLIWLLDYIAGTWHCSWVTIPSFQEHSSPGPKESKCSD